MKGVMKSTALLLGIALIAAGAGLVAARGYAYVKPQYVVGDHSVQQAHTGQQVILLGTAWCGYCARTREFFNARGVDFADLDIEESPLAREWLDAASTDGGVPVVMIGDRLIRGFRPDVMEKALSAIDAGS
jgi:mycoredoxin